MSLWIGYCPRAFRLVSRALIKYIPFVEIQYPGGGGGGGGERGGEACCREGCILGT